MNITKTTRTFEGTLSDGRDFTLDIIKRDENWLFGVNAKGTHFYTTSQDFAATEMKGVEIPMKILVDLRILGIPDEDAKVFVDVLGELVNKDA